MLRILIFEEMESFIKQQPIIFKILCDSISTGVLIIDQKERIKASNPMGAELFGYTHQEIRGSSVETLFIKDQHIEFSELFSNIFAHQTDHVNPPLQLEGKARNGQIIPIEIRLSSFMAEKEKFILMILADISIYKKQEEEILQLNRHLGELVDSRTQKLSELIEELKDEIIKRKEAESKIKIALEKERELNDLKTKFLSLVSHEFKTPLSVILSSATLAEKYKTTDEQDKREKHLRNIRVKVKALNTILNDFLSIERLHAGTNTYQMDYFPLSRVINNVVYDANMLSKTGQKISYPENLTNEFMIFYDEKILELSLANLINNSIKYSPKYGQINIFVSLEKEYIAIQVKDQGIGIPKSEQKHIFDPYFRAHNALLENGTGIGLNIVKGHLEKLNSQLSFESEEGKGSTFSIRIPINKL